MKSKELKEVQRIQKIPIDTEVLKQVYHTLLIARDAKVNYDTDHLKMAEDILIKIRANCEYTLNQLYPYLPYDIKTGVVIIE